MWTCTKTCNKSWLWFLKIESFVLLRKSGCGRFVPTKCYYTKVWAKHTAMMFVCFLMKMLLVLIFFFSPFHLLLCNLSGFCFVTFSKNVSRPLKFLLASVLTGEHYNIGSWPVFSFETVTSVSLFYGSFSVSGSQLLRFIFTVPAAWHNCFVYPPL